METARDEQGGPGAAEGSIHRGLTGGGAVRFLAVEARVIADRVRQLHELEPDAAGLAAEALVSALLMSAWIKGDERISLQVQGERPRFAFLADVDAQGGARARLSPPTLRLPSPRLVGLLLAIKSTAKSELYRGVTALDDQTLEEALLGHLGSSDQLDVILRLQATVAPDGSIAAAGGLVLERLPEAADQPSMDPETFARTFAALPGEPVADLLTALAFGKIAGHAVSVLESRPVFWRCSCSQQRIEAVLSQLGGDELSAMQREDGGAEVTCNFCNVAYTVSAARLGELAAAGRAP